MAPGAPVGGAAPMTPEGAIGLQQQTAGGLMQPGSDYFKRLADQLQGRIGAQGEAAQRATALRGAYAGFGGGMSPEAMQAAGDIGAAGQQAMGAAGADLALAAPQLGLQAMQGTFAPQLGWGQLGEQAREFGLGQQLSREQLAEQSRQYGAGLGQQAGLTQQQLAAQQAWQQAQLWQQQQMANIQMMMSLFGGGGLF